MLKQGREYAQEREAALAAAVKEVASELRLIEAADLVAYLRTEQFGNVRSLVNASIEMYFKPGTLRFGLAGHAEVSWNSAPRIVLDMEFHHRGVNVFFRLLLEDDEGGVEIDYISFGSAPAAEPGENTIRLMEALADARIALAQPEASSPPTCRERVKRTCFG
jgi:hypothetical protein